MKTRIASLAVVILFSAAISAQAATTVTVKGVHLCCGQCLKAVGKAVGAVEGVGVSCNKKARTVTIVAENDAAAQKALDALAKAGFHGTTGNKKLAIKDDSKAGKEKVSRIVVSGAHNCCGACSKAIKTLISKVSGVDGVGVKPRAKSFAVEGNFVPADVIKALNGAGFHATLKK